MQKNLNFKHFIVLTLLITPFAVASQGTVLPESVKNQSRERWDYLTFLDVSPGDALCIPFSLIMMDFMRKYKEIPFSKLPDDVKEYLILAELFAVTRADDSFGVSVWKTYSAVYKKLEVSDPARLNKLRKQFNASTLGYWKVILLTLKDLAPQANTAFPYKEDLLSLPNTTALYALFQYARKYNLPIGIHWRSVKLYSQGLQKAVHCTKFYHCQTQGVLTPLDITPSSACSFIRFIVVLDGNEETLLNSAFEKTKIDDVINEPLPEEHLYQLAAVADLADFKDSVKNDLVSFVSTHLAFMKQIYEKAKELTKLMHGDDSYTIDNKTKYKMSPIIRLDHAYIAS